MKWFDRLRDPKRRDRSGEPAHGVHLTIAGAPEPGADARIWAVGGGKGGVGKTMVATNIGVLLSRQGYRVLLVDADLGAANLHTFLGVEGSKVSLSSFLKGRVRDVETLISKTGIPNLELISGAKDSLDIADIDEKAVSRLRDALRKVNFDYVIIDVSPGTSSRTMDIFLIADEGVVVTTPEPTSVENTYRFLKCLMLRWIRHAINSEEDSRLKELLGQVFSGDWSKRIKTVADIVAQLKQMDTDQGEALKSLLGDISLSIILNRSVSPDDMELGSSMRRACRDYFGIDIAYLGAICQETSVEESVRLRRPLTVHYNSSSAAVAVEACVRNLMGNRNRQNSPRAAER